MNFLIYNLIDFVLVWELGNWVTLYFPRNEVKAFNARLLFSFLITSNPAKRIILLFIYWYLPYLWYKGNLFWAFVGVFLLPLHFAMHFLQHFKTNKTKNNLWFEISLSAGHILVDKTHRSYLNIVIRISELTAR